ncbi:MAG: GNAT family N-acetyltransferase [Oscillospiraceae bacterium]|nr:GNAT family N-acetyltransferase [Oscillospiraceae bacterium]
MRVKIRIASPDDAKAISKLIREELLTPVSASDTAQGLSQLCVNPRHKIFVAAVDDAVVGFLHACDYDSLLLTAPMKSILSLAVGASYRRIGIGKALLHRAECWAFEQGAGGIRMDGSAAADAAVKFFTACGYAGTPFTKEFEKSR